MSNEVVIRPGSRVRVRDAHGQEQSLRIRSSDPASWTVDNVSCDTALAAALIGKRAGDEVELRVHEALPVDRLTVLSVKAPGTETPA